MPSVDAIPNDLSSFLSYFTSAFCPDRIVPEAEIDSFSPLVMCLLKEKMVAGGEREPETWMIFQEIGMPSSESRLCKADLIRSATSRGARRRTIPVLLWRYLTVFRL